MRKNEKNEIVFLGGEFDGLVMDVSDRTMSWPLAITLEMVVDDGKTPVGSDGYVDGIMKTKVVKYTVLNCGEEPNDGDSFAQYMHESTTEERYDSNNYVNDPNEPFHPNNNSK